MTFYPLIKKECKQNIIIYIIPYLILILLWILFQKGRFISLKLAEILAVTLPVSIAGAYGLQAFDMEENGQTRDFLLTKPLTATHILWTKFLTGLTILLPITLLWIALLLPKAFLIPNISNIESFWLPAMVLLTLNVYTVTFTVGVFVKGPLKMVASIAIIPISCGWFFFTWSQFLTGLFWNEWIATKVPFNFLLITCFTALLLFFLVTTSHQIAYWNISKLSFIQLKKEFYRIMFWIIITPLFLSIFNYWTQPSIRPFNHFLAALFNIEEWFVPLEGVKQPGGSLYAFNDSRGRLGLAKIGEKPYVIYKPKSASCNRTANLLTNITWSPDGAQLAFSEKHHLKVYDVKCRKITRLTEGDIPLWSNDGTKLISARLLDTQTAASGAGTVYIYKYQLIEVNLITGNKRPLGQLTSAVPSMAWDSVRNRILAVDISGNLAVIDLQNQTLTNLPLFRAKPFERVIFSKIMTAADSNHYQIMVYSFDLNELENKNTRNKHYNVRGFDMNYQTDQIKQQFLLKRRSYKDVMFTEDPNRLLIRSANNGIYRLITLPKEVNQ